MVVPPVLDSFMHHRLGLLFPEATNKPSIHHAVWVKQLHSWSQLISSDHQQRFPATQRHWEIKHHRNFRRLCHGNCSLQITWQWLADSKKKSQWLKILQFSGQKKSALLHWILTSDSWFYMNRFPNWQTWTCRYQIYIYIYMYIHVCVLSVLVSISSLVGLVHLCFELVLAPEILVMITQGMSMGFLFVL